MSNDRATGIFFSVLRGDRRHEGGSEREPREKGEWRREKSKRFTLPTVTLPGKILSVVRSPYCVLHSRVLSVGLLGPDSRDLPPPIPSPTPTPIATAAAAKC